jgi:ADP-dependent NAD(P)H-hydrate dehydratase / NAD(P)H-hydrate epimerase
MREIDRLTTERFAIPSLLLMESAAAASARAIAARLGRDLAGLRVLVLCGRGNNGGDGAALARLLWLAGAGVEVVLLGRVEEARGDARANFEIVRQLSRGVPAGEQSGRPTDGGDAGPGASRSHPTGLRLDFSECAGADEWPRVRGRLSVCDVLVDALFGTGLTRPLEGLFREVVRDVSDVRASGACASSGRPLVVSLDLPSGLDADSCEPAGAAVRADLTVTFTAPKPANVLPPASHSNGRLVVADIGSPAALVEESPSRLFLTEAEDARAWLRQTRYLPDSYKNTHGHAVVFAGSRGMTGAAVLAATAAMRSGAGLVTVASPESAAAAVAARVVPEVMTAALAETPEGAFGESAVERAFELAGRADVLAVGPGLTRGPETRGFVRRLVEGRRAPVVIDADGLNCLAPWPVELRGTDEYPLILTPHAGEMRRLLGGVSGGSSVAGGSDAAVEVGARGGSETSVDDATDEDATDEGSASDEVFVSSSDEVSVSGEDVLRDRVGAAREFAVAHDLFVVLKGSRTLVAAPDGRVFVNPTGNAGLGTAGSGDTLTGIITGFLAQSRGLFGARADALAAVLAAVFVGGAAGDLAASARGMRSMIASDITAHLGAAILALDPEGERPR